MFRWLLLCSSSAAFAMQPAVPRAVWSEPVPITALVGIWHGCLVLARSSYHADDLTFINLLSGYRQKTIPLPATVLRWAVDSYCERMILLLSNGQIALVNIRAVLLEDIMSPTCNKVFDVNFLRGYPIAYVRTPQETMQIIWANGSSCGHKNSIGKCGVQHAVSKDATHIIDVAAEEFTIKNCATGKINTFTLRNNCCFTCATRSAHCAVWNRNSISIIALDSDKIERCYKHGDITALCWSGIENHLFVARNCQVVRHDVTAEAGTLIAQAHDSLVGIVVSNDEKIVVGLTRTNECCVWYFDTPQSQTGLFERTIEMGRTVIDQLMQYATLQGAF